MMIAQRLVDAAHRPSTITAYSRMVKRYESLHSAPEFWPKRTLEENGS